MKSDAGENELLERAGALAVLAFFADRPQGTPMEVAAATALPLQTARRRLQDLQAGGYLWAERTKTFPPKRHYRIVPNAAQSARSAATLLR